eukprot:TRINITY_DN1040_c0_g1_i2.p1 TRINITY_DN1040_c0_g1~~TRINITY_DN1040_c0_g1_i2.p1  ORF type:complete len:337 (+),score=18.72 TRINITY_DN1040_c0_g1_i2:629-1639(+)
MSFFKDRLSGIERRLNECEMIRLAHTVGKNDISVWKQLFNFLQIEEFRFLWENNYIHLFLQEEEVYKTLMNHSDWTFLINFDATHCSILVHYIQSNGSSLSTREQRTTNFFIMKEQDITQNRCSSLRKNVNLRITGANDNAYSNQNFPVFVGTYNRLLPTPSYHVDIVSDISSSSNLSPPLSSSQSHLHIPTSSEHEGRGWTSFTDQNFIQPGAFRKTNRTSLVSSPLASPSQKSNQVSITHYGWNGMPRTPYSSSSSTNSSDSTTVLSTHNNSKRLKIEYETNNEPIPDQERIQSYIQSQYEPSNNIIRLPVSALIHPRSDPIKSIGQEPMSKRT